MFDVLQTANASLADAFLLALIVIVALGYWWTRKSTRHPEYAAAKEASFDALLERLVAKDATPELLDAVLTRVRDLDLTALGQQGYARGGQMADVIEQRAYELLATARALRAKVKG